MLRPFCADFAIVIVAKFAQFAIVVKNLVR